MILASVIPDEIERSTELQDRPFGRQPHLDRATGKLLKRKAGSCANGRPNLGGFLSHGVKFVIERKDADQTIGIRFRSCKTQPVDCLGIQQIRLPHLAAIGSEDEPLRHRAYGIDNAAIVCQIVSLNDFNRIAFNDEVSPLTVHDTDLQETVEEELDVVEQSISEIVSLLGDEPENVG